jgi:hypothetical protein
MLNAKIFKTVIENTPLVSIGLCLVCDGQLSFGKCTNEPLKGEWNHLSSNSACDESISTHYLNLPHFSRFKFKPPILGDDQHHNLDWFDLDKVESDEGFDKYIRDYAGYLTNKGIHDVRN